MNTSDPKFYQPGGALRPDAPCYVERRADNDLYASLQQGKFCYVLTSRQMGKSSLMGRVATRLRREGISVVILDLTAIGQNLTAEQWCGGLLERVGQQLDMEDELEEFWLGHQRLGPLQRWVTALREVVLPRCPGGLVIFVDEIDAVRSLPFSADEFFAGIRECYNRRIEDPEFARLAFCLLGVATPSDLIQDSRTTPFNVGRRIELADFTEGEAAPLAQGLDRDERRARKLLRRILAWTGGHPYLTQRLCQAVAEDASVTSPSGVDRLCKELFLSRGARESDDNLLFVRERFVRSEADLAGLLDLYGQVGSGKPVRLDDTNQLVGLLRLSGITRVAQGSLRVRNRIYERVFDRAWVTAHMPDAEVRRQRAAYRRGLLRATAIAAVVVAMVGGLALVALTQAHRANQQRSVAEAQRLEARRNLYVAQMKLVQQSWAEGNVERAQGLLDAWRPTPEQEDLRGFEWRYLWRLCQSDALFTFYGHTDGVTSVAFSPDGKTFASGSLDRTVKLWDVETRQEVATLTGHIGVVNSLAFSPDGKVLATGSGDSTVKLWRGGPQWRGRSLSASPQELAAPKGHNGPVLSVTFSPDGKVLATGSDDSTVKLWDLHTKREIATLKGHTAFVSGLAFSPHSDILASASGDGTVRLWDVARQRGASILKGHVGEVACVVFSPDGRTFASGAWEGIKLWDVATRRDIVTLKGHFGGVLSVAFSPDGRYLASAGADGTLKLWDVNTRQEVATFRGHKGPACVMFSPDGRHLVSGSDDYTVKLWSTFTTGAPSVLKGHQENVDSVAFSPDGKLVASSSWDRSARLWDVATGRLLATLKGHKDPLSDVAFSPDGKLVASASGPTSEQDRPGEVKVWDVAGKRELATLKGSRKGPRGAVQAVAFSPDGQILAAGNSDRTVTVWNVASRRAVATLVGYDDYWGLHNSLAFSPDGALMAMASLGHTVKLWEVGRWSGLATLKGHKHGVRSIAFSPDGKFLASASFDATAKLWDVATKKEVATLKGHTGQVWGVIFSPDGKTLATSGADGTVRLWNVAMKQEVATLRGHTGSVESVAFSPDGNTLASVGDTTVRLWRAASFQETDLPVVSSSGGDRAVILQWRPLPWAVGYNIYRRPGIEPSWERGLPARMVDRQGWVKLSPQTVSEASFTDRSPGLINGAAYTYAVTAIYRDAGGRIGEGPPVKLTAAPVQVPSGWLGTSINEGERCGSASLDPGTGKITLRGAGMDLWGPAAGGYFLHQPVSGDFQLTVTMLTRPHGSTHRRTKGGPMIRETLDPQSRAADLMVYHAGPGLCFQWKWSTAPDDKNTTGSLISDEALEMPITLRLIRQGDTITAQYSTDQGRSFHPAGDPLTFDPPLAGKLYAGLAITAHDARQIGEAKFRGLEIRKH